MFLAVSVEAREFVVDSQEQFWAHAQNLNPGDTIVLADGIWRDFEIQLEGQGTEQQPITLTAQTPGGVIISGQSNLTLAGEYLVVSNLVFRDGYTPTDSVISFRNGEGVLANHSRVTEVVVDNFSNPERFEPDSWVTIYGRHNRFDHNHLEGKRNKGVTLAVRLNTPASQENYHRIDHNYFGPRPVLGSNGGETLRIGTSHYSLTNSFTTVENNYFDRCDGEVEIISVKSGGNRVVGNFFYESRGTLTLRHGNDNLVKDNVFQGNRIDHTGGIRVINKRQTVRNNYLEGLTGYRFGGALVVMNGVPDSPINRYHQVDGATIENNTLIDSDHIQLAAGSDQERSAVPVNSVFRKNLLVNEDGRDVFTVFDDISGIRFSENARSHVVDPSIVTGFTSQDVALVERSNGLKYPESKELDGVGVSSDLAVLKKADTGSPWYPKPMGVIQFDSGRVAELSPAPGVLEAAVVRAEAGDILNLAPGQYSVSKVLNVSKPVTLRGHGEAEITFERSTLFEIADGGSLKLQGVNISGAKAPDNVGNSVIRTSRYSMLVNYRLVIENSEISSLDVNRHFDVLNVSKSTMADSIVISGSRFEDISGAILKLDKEFDDYGIYNAEYVSISDSEFVNVQGAIADLYRGGTDESTFGPHFALKSSVISGVGRGAKNKYQSSIFLHGVQVTDIENNSFVDAAPIRINHTVGEPVTQISNNRFSGTQPPQVQELNSVKTNTARLVDNDFVE